MRNSTSRLERNSPTVLAIAVLISGAAAGVIFGERSIPQSEDGVVLQSSRIVANLVEWLPDETDPADLVYDGIGGMLEVLDPHSHFLDPRNYQKMRARQEGSFFGVGIIISRRGGKVTVIAPMAGTPAAHKGLRAGDVIAAVGGELTEDLVLDDVVDLVRGPEGSVVHLTLQRPGLSEPIEVEITRARIPTNSVRFAFMLDDTVGYIRLSEFSNTSVREVQDAVRRLNEEGMESLVFDLRNNPGGSLDAAVGVADTFLRKNQLVVTTRGRTADSHSTLAAPGDGFHLSGPLVVLVNTGSASASEIVAGAVQDHDRGLVLGEVTWGKGLVQTVFAVRDTGLALTTARYYTPSGRCIQRDYEASYIDYITHRSGVSQEETKTAKVFATDGGRSVRGGGGVTPDITVDSRQLTEGLVRLYGRSGFFRFGVELLKDIAEEDQAAFGEDFQVSDEILERLGTFLADQEIMAAEDFETLIADEQARTDIKRALQVEVLNTTLGLEAGYQYAITGDEQLLAVHDQLAKAKELWLAWQEATPEL